MSSSTLQATGNPRGFRRTLSLSSDQLEAVLSECDRAERAYPNRQERAEPRAPYRTDRPIEATMWHPGGGVGRFLVHPIDLSRSGMSFLHGGFVHKGSLCMVSLLTRENTTIDVEGRVIWCRHCSGNCHAIGVQFIAQVDVRPFVDIEKFAGATAHIRAADLHRIVGRVIAIESQPIAADLLELVVSGTGINMTVVGDFKAALAIMEAEPIDLIMCELDLESGTGEDVISQCRQHGFKRPVLVVTGVTDPSRIEAVMSNRSIEVVHKPFDPALLLRIISQHLESDGLAVTLTPLPTALDADLAAKRQVHRYIKRLQEAIAALQAAMPKADVGASRAVCQSLRVSAEAYGYPLLAEAARRALAALAASESVQESRDDILRVVMIVERIARAIADHPASVGIVPPSNDTV